jgi:hypothetical protein
MSASVLVAPSPLVSPSQPAQDRVTIHAPFLSQFLAFEASQRLGTISNLLIGLGVSVEALRMTSDPEIFTMASPTNQVGRVKRIILNDGREAIYFRSSVAAVAEVEVCVGQIQYVATVPLASIDLKYSEDGTYGAKRILRYS